MIARRHMAQFGTTREHLAAVAVKNHANGAKNPLAHMRKTVTMEQALKGKPVSDPLTVYDCSLISDGAAAVLVCPLEQASEFTDKPVLVRGMGRPRIMSLSIRKKTSLLSIPRAGCRKGLQDGGRESDATSSSLKSTIASRSRKSSPPRISGLSESGEGGPFAAEGCTALDGRIPINASGGLKSKGHPVGATGTGQICDLVLQIRGEAGDCK